MKDLAIQRIEGLFELAMDNASSNPSLSCRYVEMALEISKRTRVRVPKKWKYFVCKSCHSLLYPGISCRARISRRRSPHVVLTCLICGEIKRYLIKKRKK